MDEYAEVWEKFKRERRLEFGGHKDPSWQHGHACSASVMVGVDVARFRERLEPPRDALRAFPFVSLHPDHFMHITLVLLGFLVSEPEEADEVSPERLEEVGGALRRTLANFPAFPVELANLNAFPGAAFIETHDAGMLEKLRDAVCGGCGLEKPPGPPHLTLAYFQVPDGTPAPDGLVSAIERYREWPVGSFEVKSVEMTLLDLGKDYPKPKVFAKIPLKSRNAVPSG